jgi:hypothetical protein
MRTANIMKLLLFSLLLVSGQSWARSGHGGGYHGGGGHFAGHGGHGGFSIGFYGGYPYYGYPFYRDPFFYGYGYPYYSSPVIVTTPATPPTYIEQSPSVQSQELAAGYWYYCQNPAGYYPYVKECQEPWQQVEPTPPSSR